ncbi:hypothetical protein BDN71DRAFT_1505130 [Pleurotus eryngii]|uniref:Uncharacterized protein n=1 Tax=Pleurotus eryngii TaxID=5323 RepID=A0A9P6A4N4_PLEER|nr:hypothetical protein BDN71DRAFT_1505130 [Pleurotus eryngii]
MYEVAPLIYNLIFRNKPCSLLRVGLALLDVEELGPQLQHLLCITYDLRFSSNCYKGQAFCCVIPQHLLSLRKQIKQVFTRFRRFRRLRRLLIVTMKFVIAFVALAAVVAAMPSCGGNYQNQNTRVSGSYFKSIDDPKHPPLCWLVCWETEPTCPDGWHSKSMDTEDYCWTCCLNDSENH